MDANDHRLRVCLYVATASIGGGGAGKKWKEEQQQQQKYKKKKLQLAAVIVLGSTASYGNQEGLQQVPRRAVPHSRWTREQHLFDDELIKCE